MCLACLGYLMLPISTSEYFLHHCLRVLHFNSPRLNNVVTHFHLFFSVPARTITQISSPLSYKLWTEIKQSVVLMENTRLFLSPLRPPPVSQTQKTIPSYPGLAWENDKKNYKCPQKTARELVWKGEWGGRGHDWRKWAGRKEGERQRKGKEEAGVLNKLNKWNESGAAFWEEKSQQMDFWNINIMTLYYW